MSLGRLYGVGVGPGDPELLTLRAARILKAAPVLAIPRSSDWGDSMAWKIAAPVVGDVAGQERLFLTFPMSKEPERLKPFWEKALDEIGRRIEAGRDVAFLTLGDPFLYSTFIYLHGEAPRRWPGIEIEVVPGVTSLTAAAIASGRPLADGQERIAILPATYEREELVGFLEAFDTIVLMKVGGNLGALRAALEETNLVEKAVYVSRATAADEKVIADIAAITEKDMDCFSTIIVSKKERSGLLMGRAPAAEASP